MSSGLQEVGDVTNSQGMSHNPLEMCYQRIDKALPGEDVV